MTAFIRVVARGCALACGLCTALPPAVAAQQIHALLPDTTAARLVAFFNRETTTRFHGEARIGAGTTVQGDVAALNGPLSIDGTVAGDVLVINGSLLLGASARITGSVTVVGGAAHIDTAADAPGGVTVYREPLRYRVGDRGMVAVVEEAEAALAAGRDFPFGRTELLVAAHGAYNRVEGLPIAIGPRVRFGGTHPTTARLLLVARTATSDRIDPKRFGYELRAEQLIAPRIGVTFGARLFAEVAPVEALGLTDREAAFATFLLHRDYRDHYEREGWSAYAQFARPGSRYDLTLEYRDEEHVAMAPADPFTLLRNSEGWRAEPSIAQGPLRSLVASARYDTRNEKRDPAAGWYIDLQLEQGLGGGIANPALEVPRPARSGFIASRIDVRRYARLSPYARIGVRMLGAGSLDARPLPPQRQHALGGVGSLPAYEAFAFDCGARRTTSDIEGEPFHPYYGCDRVALVQLEYQAGFPFARRLAESIGLSASVGQLARWVAFFDAGRAWNEPGAGDGRLGGRDDFSADAGLGIRLGPLGAYWAIPLSSGSSGVHFFVRLDPRI